MFSNFINNLNCSEKLQIGEKGHIEYSWSEKIQEKIIQLNFQLVRTDNKNNINIIRNIYRNLLVDINNRINLNSNDYEAKHYLTLLYKLIAYTRDIIDGKGEYYLSYVLLYEWYENINNELALFMLNYFVYNCGKEKPLGSWKDIKYLCNYIYEINPNSSFIIKCVKLANDQLKKDYDNYFTQNSTISLVSKWIPREKNKFRWQYEVFACDYFLNYIESAKNDMSCKNAILKSKTEYRKILSILNKYIETTQIYMCSNMWQNIDFNKVTSITLLKQKNAFLNKHKNEDRLICYSHFKNHLIDATYNIYKLKGHNIELSDFTKYAIELLKIYDDTLNNEYNDTEIQINFLNLLWKNNNLIKNDNMNKIIVMIDFSNSLDEKVKHTSISLGIKIAEKSLFGKRLISFESTPILINLSDCPDFFSCIKKINKTYFKTQNATYFDIYKAFDIILDSIVENKLTSEETQDMIFVILSDMQLESFENFSKLPLYESIKMKYKEAGLKINGKPYKVPHIIFWNLKYTNGFPCLSNQENVSMISGFNSSVLNIFCETKYKSFFPTTPNHILEKLLNNKRYKIFENKINEYYS